jgi:hypothetical protein
MQILLAVTVIALLGGLLWSLWFVLTNPRRRARHVKTELSAPPVRKSDAVVVRYRRWVHGAMALLFIDLIANAATSRWHNAGAIVLALVIFLPLVVVFGRLAISDSTVLVITGEGLVTSRPHRRLRWEDIETMAIHEGRGSTGFETYELVLHVTRDRTEPPTRHLRGVATTEDDAISVQLTFLVPSWHEVARAIQERSGRLPIVPSRYAPTQWDEAQTEPA